jgi:hypothetical protein
MQKDPFGLPGIDQVVDSIAGCSLLFFLDCYSRYHQIPLKVEYQITTSFITSFSTFCYNYVLWTQKHECNLPTGYTMVSVFASWAQRRSIY